MARRVCNHLKFLLSSHKFQKPIHFQSPSDISRLGYQCFSILSCLRNHIDGSYCHTVLESRSYSSSRGKYYDLFGNGKPGDEEFRKAWGNETDEDTSLWTGSDEDEDEISDAKKKQSRLKKEIRKAEKKAKEEADLIDGDDSDELNSVWSGSDEEKTLWTGDECDDDDDIPTEAYPNEKSDAYLDKLFEFEETPKYRTISELLKSEHEPELSPGKQARKIAVENALKKLKKGPDGRYTNVWEVMSDIDILVGAFEHIVSGPEYSELRQGGPKKLDMEFFKDIQAKMRDPNFKWSTELKLKPKNKLVSRKKWRKTQSRRRKAQKRLWQGCRVKWGHNILNSEQAECLAFLEAVTWSKEIDITHLVIHTDLKCIANFVKGEAHSIAWENESILLDALCILNTFSFWDCNHIPRICNKAADILAKFSRRGKLSRDWYDNPPDIIVNQINADSVALTS